jgi:hypothetical protein
MEMGFIAYPRSFGGFSESKQQLTFIRVCGDAAHLLPLIECGQIGTHKVSALTKMKCSTSADIPGAMPSPTAKTKRSPNGHQKI